MLAPAPEPGFNWQFSLRFTHYDIATHLLAVDLLNHRGELTRFFFEWYAYCRGVDLSCQRVYALVVLETVLQIQSAFGDFDLSLRLRTLFKGSVI